MQGSMQQTVPQVRNNRDQGRFEIDLDGQLGILEYEIAEGRMIMPHTEVPVAQRGRGYGERLARAALDYAREQSLTPEPLCPFVRAFIARHPEYA
jgi:predicted GNAT family acetyltransferase